jgi:adenylosuccinate lyase
VEKGLDRQAAYVLVQRNALPAWEEDQDFETNLRNDPEVQAVLTPTEIAACFDLNHALRHVDAIFERVFQD